MSFLRYSKTVRQNANVNVTGSAILKMRQTKAGNLLIEINGGAETAEIVRAEVECSLGSGAWIRGTEHWAAIELCGFDGMTTKEEILNAVSDGAST